MPVTFFERKLSGLAAFEKGSFRKNSWLFLLVFLFSSQGYRLLTFQNYCSNMKNEKAKTPNQWSKYFPKLRSTSSSECVLYAALNSTTVRVAPIYT